MEVIGDILSRCDNLSVPEPNSGCWLWAGMVDKDGYAKVKYKGKMTRAARQIFIEINNTVPEVVGHACNNKLCVNPNHLYPTTFVENSNHAKRDGLYRTGSKHPKAILWDGDDVATIEYLYTIGNSQQAIADHFGVHQSRISEVLRGKYIRKDAR